jgi:hypothetical protein
VNAAVGEPHFHGRIERARDSAAEALDGEDLLEVLDSTRVLDQLRVPRS